MTTVHELTEKTGIQLDPSDWFRATWRDLAPLPRPTEATTELQRWALEHTPEMYIHYTLERNSYAMADEFAQFMLPHLPFAKRISLQSMIPDEITAVPFPTQNGQTPPVSFLLATYLGMHAPLEMIVGSWADDFFGKHAYRSQMPDLRRPYDMVLGLGSAKLVAFHMRRLHLGIRTPDAIRAWLANTELSDLAVIEQSILAETGIKRSQLLIQALGRVVSPAVAPYMLTIMLGSQGGAEARLWLNEHPHETIQGLIPVAEGRGKAADTARDFLRTFARGHAELLERYAEPKLRAKLLDKSGTAGNVRFDTVTTPDWLKEGTRTLHRLSSSDTERVIEIERLPQLTVGEWALNAEQVKAVLLALWLNDSKNAQAHDAAQNFASALRTHLSQPVLDRFAWAIVESWLHAGTPPRERWLLNSLLLLGSDQVLAKFYPLIREWATQKKTKLVKIGLDCLSYVGSDAALTELFRLERAFKSARQRTMVRVQIEATAKARGLTQDQLADRIVPDCGLDADGNHVFDYGARQFGFALGGSLKPMIRDETGKLRADLPKPIRMDDPEKAALALADWRLIKQQIHDAATVQAARLERQMINEWRWSWPEFERFFLQHPLMRHFAQMFVWGCFGDGLRSTFRVASDYTFADQTDHPTEPDRAARIGIVHPIHLNESERHIWGQVMADYDVIPPFPQIGRELYTPTPEEISDNNLHRFRGRQTHILGVTSTLRNLGWDESGEIRRYFTGTDILTHVILNFSGRDGYASFNRLQFFKGAVPDYSGNNQGRLPYETIPLLVMSEVIRALSIVFKA